MNISLLKAQAREEFENKMKEVIGTEYEVAIKHARIQNAIKLIEGFLDSIITLTIKSYRDEVELEEKEFFNGPEHSGCESGDFCRDCGEKVGWRLARAEQLRRMDKFEGKV